MASDDNKLLIQVEDISFQAVTGPAASRSTSSAGAGTASTYAATGQAAQAPGAWTTTNPMPVKMVGQQSAARTPEGRASKEEIVESPSTRILNVATDFISKHFPILGGLIDKTRAVVEASKAAFDEIRGGLAKSPIAAAVVEGAVAGQIAGKVQQKAQQAPQAQAPEEIQDVIKVSPVESAEMSLKKAALDRQMAGDAIRYRAQQDKINADPALKAEASLKAINLGREETAKASRSIPSVLPVGEAAGAGAGAETAAAGGLATFAATVGPAALAVTALTAAATAFKFAVDGVIARGKEIQQYSPQISVANAQAEIRQMRADMHEAGNTGAEIAKLVETNSRFTTELQRILEPIKKFIADILGRIMERLADIAETWGPLIGSQLETQLSMLRIMIDLATGDIVGLFKDVKNMPTNVAKAFERKPENGLFLDQFQQLADAAGAFAQGLAQPVKRNANAGGAAAAFSM